MAEEEIQDRFTTHWAGEFDIRYLQWASTHGVGPINMTTPGSPFSTFLLRENGPDFATFRVMNRAADQEERARHAADPDRSTGTGGLSREWRGSTRGEKLRFGDQIIEMYENVLSLARGYQGVVEQKIAECEEGKVEKWKAILEILKVRVELAVQAANAQRDFNQLVEDETLPGWNWREGLDAQNKLRMDVQILLGMKLNETAVQLDLASRGEAEMRAAIGL